MTGHVAPARYVLAVLHRQDPDAGPGRDGEGEPTIGRTRCGLHMAVSELWQPVEAREESDQLCAGCENPGSTTTDVQEALL